MSQDTDQPALFDLQQWEAELVRVRDQERFSGSIVERDQRMVAAVLAAVAAGVPRRNICDLARISSHTVQGIVERAEKSGSIAPFKQRILGSLRRGAETLASSLIEDVETGELPPQSKPVALGILLDKCMLLDGEATARVEVRHVDPDRVWDRIQRVKDALEVAPTDSESRETALIACVSSDPQAQATEQATSSGAQEADGAAAPAGDPEASGTAAEAGGGVADGAPPPRTSLVPEIRHNPKSA